MMGSFHGRCNLRMMKMRNNTFVGNNGHFHAEICPQSQLIADGTSSLEGSPFTSKCCSSQVSRITGANEFYDPSFHDIVKTNVDIPKTIRLCRVAASCEHFFANVPSRASRSVTLTNAHSCFQQVMILGKLLSRINLGNRISSIVFLDWRARWLQMLLRPSVLCGGEVIVQGDEGPVCGVAQG